MNIKTPITGMGNKPKMMISTVVIWFTDRIAAIDFAQTSTLKLQKTIHVAMS